MPLRVCLSFYRAHTKYDAKVICSPCLSFLLFTGSRGGGGTQPKSAHAQRGLGTHDKVHIMHCSLHVISLITCCQKEELEACTYLYSQAARHPGKVLPAPPGMSTLSPSDIGTTAVCGKKSRFELHCILFTGVVNIPIYNAGIIHSMEVSK